MRWTVAFAVWTLPQTTAAWLSAETVGRSPPEKSSERTVPSTVVTSPAASRSSSVRFSGTTCAVRIEVSSSVSARTALSSSSEKASNASLIGAKTVAPSRPFSVSPRPASPTAVTSVDRSGLFEAAVATGSSAMPSDEPSPSAGTAEQASPTGVSVRADSMSSDAVSSVMSSAVSASELHAARASERAATDPNSAARLRIVVIMLVAPEESVGGAGSLWSACPRMCVRLRS